MLNAISPIDGRYEDKTAVLQHLFSESALMRYRCHVEIEYLIALQETGVIPAYNMLPDQPASLRSIVTDFSEADALRIKAIESTINHDVKAIEYFIKEKLDALGLTKIREWVHFGLTSQDINNSAFPLMIREAYTQYILPSIQGVFQTIQAFGQQNKDVPMLAYTHGQPATPTRFGKEMMVFADRLEAQVIHLNAVDLKVKFGGATGNFNAQAIAFPNINWPEWADHFTQKYLSIDRYHHTTQIEHYDELAAVCHATMRINTILIDFCRDMWAYISMNYLTQKANPREVGSSAMPHKVNPIDFENAEGNLGYANAIFSHLAEKLPISRLQRDLTDSTVLRNVGVPLAHSLISYLSIQKGLAKLSVNRQKMELDLDANWAVLAEAIQTILRRESIANPYELLKDLTRGKERVTKQDLHDFIDRLDVNQALKEELKKLRPADYTGYI